MKRSRESSASEKEGNPSKKKLLPPTKQKFRKEYTEKWTFLGPSSKGAHHVYCKLCYKDFACSHGGKNDCFKHTETQFHKDAVGRSTAQRQPAITGFVAPKKEETGPVSDLKRQVTRAEVTMCEMIAELNLPLATANSLSQAFRGMFPDSKIAKDMQCCRNKATSMIKKLSEQTQETLAERMKSQAFTISTDGSNDDKSKQFPIVVRTFNSETSEVTSELLSVPVCKESATGENIFKLVNAELEVRGIEWKNCLSLGCDNAFVMTGQHKGVYAFVAEKQPDVFLAGCTLHVLHNAAKKAAGCLPPIEDILVDIYHYFKKSTCRQERFLQAQDFCDVEQRRMLKHVCTRWLSIGRCLARMLQNWDALKVFFSKESKPGASTSSSYAQQKVDTIFTFVRSPTNRLYALFLVHTITVFDGMLVGFQAEAPKIQELRRAMLKLIRCILTKFVKPSAMIGKPLTDVQYKLAYNLKTDAEIEIGEEARSFLEAKEMNHLKDQRIQEFFANVRKYFQTLCDYLLEKLPLSNKVLEHVEVADPALKTAKSSADLKFFLKKFPCLMPSGCTVNDIVSQFNLYQVADISDCISGSERVDESWIRIAKLQDETGEHHLKDLAHVMCGLLTIPHSSAHCERVFSCVRKNRTDQRSCLSDETLESLLVVKSRPHSFGKRKYSREALDTLKKAYYEQKKKNQ